jgi:hypothetical protein
LKGWKRNIGSLVCIVGFANDSSLQSYALISFQGLVSKTLFLKPIPSFASFAWLVGFANDSSLQRIGSFASKAFGFAEIPCIVGFANESSLQSFALIPCKT